VFLSGDTKFDPDLIAMYEDRAEIFFHDASIKKNAVHASTGELATLSESIRSRMYLLHYQDETTADDAKEFAGLALQNKRYIFT
jgi:ribonuclease BN (tRNA processing enzyme)